MPEPFTTSDTPNSVYTGSESFFSFFSQAQVALQTFRLALDGRVLAQASDLASQMENTRRAFQHNGKFVETVQGVLRIAAQLQQRTQAWDREVQSIERSKHSKSGNALQQLRAEISNGRLKSQMTERIVSKLEIVLYQLESEEAERLAGQTAPTESHIKSSSDSDETCSVVSQVVEAVCELVGEGLIVNFDEKTAFVADSNVREFFWDQPLVLLVAQWHNEEPDMSNLTFWLIPKFLDIVNHIESVASALQLEVVGAIRCEQLAWKLAPYGIDLWPQSQPIQQAIGKLISKRFEKDPMKLVAISASLPADWTGHDSIRIENRI